MTVSNVKFNSLSLWVQIWGAPFNMFSPKVAMEVGSPKSLFQYLNQSGEAVILQDLMGGRTWVSFKYERLPMLCHYYGLLGHDTRHCAGHYAASKNGKEVGKQDTT